MSTRRAILQLIGAAPVGAASVKGEIASMLASPAVATAVALSGGSDCARPVSGPVSLLGKQLSRLNQSARAESDARRNLRYAQIDPDIAVLRSMSATRKARIQYERDTEEANMFNHIQRVLYGE